MARKVYKNPYDPGRAGPVKQRLEEKKSNRAFEMELKRVRPGEVANYYDPQIDPLKTAADKEAFDRAKAVRASKTGFAQHLGTLPRGVSPTGGKAKPAQRSSNDPFETDFNGVRQVGDPGKKFTG